MNFPESRQNLEKVVTQLKKELVETGMRQLDVSQEVVDILISTSNQLVKLAKTLPTMYNGEESDYQQRIEFYNLGLEMIYAKFDPIFLQDVISNSEEQELVTSLKQKLLELVEITSSIL